MDDPSLGLVSSRHDVDRRGAGHVALPYHSIGHLLTLDAKGEAMRHVFRRLRPGGRFIFDDFRVTPALLAQMREVQLRAA